MRAILIKIIIQSAAVVAVSYILPGIVVTGVLPALMAACLLSLINALIRPVLILLTFPITLVSMGIFVLFINGFCFWLASTLVDGFTVTGVWPAVFGSLLVSILTWFLNWILQDKEEMNTPYRETRRTIKVVKSQSRDVE